MTHPKNLKIADFTYDLPDKNIAYKPVFPRDSSKLLVYQKNKISESTYSQLSNYLDDSCMLVFNDTKVIKARILFQRETGAKIEIFCLEPNEEHVDYSLHFQKTNKVQWKCLVGNASKWKESFLKKVISVDGQTVELFAELIQQTDDAYIVSFSWSPQELAFGQVIDAAGATPLPPYIKREANQEDEDTYQTVYSTHEGSVAAPTAGLHFTNSLLNDLKEKGVQALFTTLHVGAGTFKPVKSETMEEHIMHDEWMDISLKLLENLRAENKRKIVTVGTTSTRTLESVFWMGNKVCNNPLIALDDLKITQWEPYESPKIHTKEEALTALIEWMKARQLTQLIIETGIIIAPSYSFKMVQGLITNFHQPHSTLLLLVAALVGDTWKEIYDYALTHDFRFLSYGDGCLLLPNG